MTGRVTLEDILQKQGVLSAEQVSQARLEQVNSARTIEEILLERGWVNETQLYQAKAVLLGVPFALIEDSEIEREVLSLIPESVARQYVLLPFAKEGNKLKVAMADPLDLQVNQFLAAKTGLQIQPYLAVPEKILEVIERVYSTGMESEVRAALKETEKEIRGMEKEVSSLREIEEEIKRAPVARIVSTILQYAVKSRASDIHIEPQANHTRVRYRIDGILRERLSLPNQVHPALVTRIKILSDLKIDVTQVPQDGRFMIHIGKGEVDLRVSTLPTAHGEKVVLRLLRKDTKVPTLAELGLRGRALKNVQESLKKTRGVILVTGPTGSGKTTTLRTSLEMKNSIQINIVTLEDPVEYEIKGINQVQINPQAGLTFASGLRSILRQDPDVIMVGEIRDHETLELVIQAALTGHLVFSTIHTNSAAGAVPRMLDMGAEPFLLSSTMETVLAQRLVRTLCTKCRQKYRVEEEIKKQILAVLGSLYSTDPKKDLELYKAVGCKECDHSGYVSRIGIFEVLVVDDKIAQLILKRATSDEIEAQARQAGMVTMLQDGYLKALEGLTTLEEVLRVAQE